MPAKVSSHSLEHLLAGRLATLNTPIVAKGKVNAELLETIAEWGNPALLKGSSGPINHLLPVCLEAMAFISFHHWSV